MSVLLATLQSYEAKQLRRETLSAMLALSGVDASNLAVLTGRSKPTNQNAELVDDITSSVHSEKSDTSDCDSSHVLSSLSKNIGVSECAEVGGAFASFLPGVAMTLTKVMTSDIKVGSSVTVLALLTWAHYVAMVMDDADITANQVVNLKIPVLSIVTLILVVQEVGGANKEEEAGPRSLAVQRSKSWCRETDRKLSVLVQRVCVLVTSEGWRVRLGLVGWAHTLLTHCHR